MSTEMERQETIAIQATPDYSRFYHLIKGALKVWDEDPSKVAVSAVIHKFIKMVQPEDT